MGFSQDDLFVRLNYVFDHLSPLVIQYQSHQQQIPTKKCVISNHELISLSSIVDSYFIRTLIGIDESYKHILYS